MGELLVLVQYERRKGGRRERVIGILDGKRKIGGREEDEEEGHDQHRRPPDN